MRIPTYKELDMLEKEELVIIIYNDLERIMTILGITDKREKFDKSLYIPVGGRHIYCDPYYSEVILEPEDDVQASKQEMINTIIDIKKRIKIFKDKILRPQRIIARQIFERKVIDEIV